MTDRAIVEKFVGRFTGILLILLNLFVFKINSFGHDFILLDKSLDITGVLFGFLLATLALIVQGGNPALDSIKSRTALFERLVSFNKIVVSASLFCLFYSFILVGTKHLWEDKNSLNSAFSSLFLGIHSWLLIDTFLFTRIFYKIITKH